MEHKLEHCALVLYFLTFDYGARIEGIVTLMSCYVKLCIGFTIIIFNNLLLCDNPFNVFVSRKNKTNKHWCSTEATVAFVTQTQK